MRSAKIAITARFGAPVALALMLSSFAAPVRAEDTILNSLASFVGMQGDKDKEPIDYRARPPLVVPPSATLPPPQAVGTGRPANWPDDPDILARRKAEADSRRPVPHLNALNDRPEMSKQDLMATRGTSAPVERRDVRDECAAGAGTPQCLYTPWSQLQVKELDGARDVPMQAGVEPEREYLTEPPKGYRKPTAVVKVTNDPSRTLADPADAGAYIRDQAQRKHSVDD